MKILILFLAITTFTIAQNNEQLDKVIKKDKTAIMGKVLKVTENSIEIDPEGTIPFIIIPRNEVDAIIYSDNTVVKFDYDDQTSANQKASDQNDDDYNNLDGPLYAPWLDLIKRGYAAGVDNETNGLNGEGGIYFTWPSTPGEKGYPFKKFICKMEMRDALCKIKDDKGEYQSHTMKYPFYYRENGTWKTIYIYLSVHYIYTITSNGFLGLGTQQYNIIAGTVDIEFRENGETTWKSRVNIGLLHNKTNDPSKVALGTLDYRGMKGHVYYVFERPFDNYVGIIFDYENEQNISFTPYPFVLSNIL